MPSLQVSVDAESTETIEQQETPGTQLRNQAGVNSPRAGKVDLSYPDPEENAGAGVPTHLVTQVERPTEKESTPEASCWSLCWSCLFCKSDAEEALTNEVQITRIDEEPSPAAIQETEDEASDSEAEEGLLGDLALEHKGKKCLVLDLDETLVHSSFKPVDDTDMVIPIVIENVTYKVYVKKRPYVDEFLTECAKHFEVAIFTASLGMYANPLLDTLDVNKTISHRLFRESCVLSGGAYVKDLSVLGRKLKNVIFVDNSHLSYKFQPENAVPITSWFDDRSDTELMDLMPVLFTTLKDCKDVRTILDANNKSFQWLCNQAKKTE